MNFPEKKIPAFKDPLVRHKEYEGFVPGRLKQFENNPNFVVRDLEDIILSQNRRLHGEIRIKSGIVAFSQKYQHFFDELREKYGILAPTHFIVAQNEKGRDTIFAVTDNVKEFEPITPEEKKRFFTEYKNLCQGLLAYIADKHQSGESYLTDIFAERQYVYGKRADDKEASFYLVDVDPYFWTGKELLEERVFTVVQGLILKGNTTNFDFSDVIARGKKIWENLRQA